MSGYLKGIGKFLLGLLLSALGFFAVLSATGHFLFGSQDEEDEYLTLGYQDGAGFVRMLNDEDGE